MTDQLVNPHLDGKPFFWAGGAVGIVLSHGYTATTAEVRPLAERLHALGFTVAGPLLPGHGETPQQANRYRWQDWAAAVEASYQQVASHCQRVFLGGESTGGVIALYLASTERLQRDGKLAGLLLYAPALALASNTGPLLAPLLSLFIKTLPKGRPITPSPADARWQGYAVDPLPAAVQLFKLQKATRRRLGRIHQPVLIIQGRNDLTVSARVPEIICQEVASTIKTVHWMEASGHCVMIDGEWEQVAALTQAFLSANGG